MVDNLRNSITERDVNQAIIALKKGSYLVKYGRRGKPKLYPFQLSTDESALIWHSGKEEKQIKLSQVLKIIPGQRTATFQRYPRPEKEYQSFSLICHDRSLDLICKDKDEADVWIFGLKTLITGGKAWKWRNNTRFDGDAVDSPGSRARRVPPHISECDPLTQGTAETAALSRLGKAFSDIVSLTAATSNIQREPYSHIPSLLSVSYTENPNARSSIGESARISLSSAVTSSSQGSYHEEAEGLSDIFIWGEGISNGVLGGTEHSSSVEKEDALLPQQLESTVGINVHNISCGSRHAMVVTRKGDISSWGEEGCGRLGHGVESDISQPRPIDSLNGTNIDTIACGELHSCAVTTSGDLYTWGEGSHLLGHGSEAGHWLPKKVTGILDGLHVSNVACGTWHTAVVTSSGRLFTFGDGAFGALGHGDRRSISIPREVKTLSRYKTTRVACGVWHTAAVAEEITQPIDSEQCSSSGQLFTWGDGDKGRLGHGETEPKLLPKHVTALADENVTRVACGHNLTVVLTTTGHVYTMGSTDFGQLGNPNSKGKVPTRVVGDIAGNVVDEIACGSYHVAVLTSKSAVFTWGKGSNGQLGHGTTENRKTPTLVEFLKDKQAKTLACGSNFTVVTCVHNLVSGSDLSLCAGCRNPFNFRRKRLNCYNCGLVFCKVCSNRRSLKAALAPDMNKPYRVCFGCFIKLKNSMETSTPYRTSRNHNNRNLATSIIVPKKESFGPKPLSHWGISSIDTILQSEGRDTGRYSIVSTSNKNVHSTRSNSSRGSTGARTNKSANALGCGMSSRNASSVSGKSSPPRFSEVTFDDSKHSGDEMRQEVANLKAQVEELTRKSQNLDEELERTTKQLKEVTAKAADEAEQSRSAKRVIKSLTAQLQEIAERKTEKDGGSSKPKGSSRDDNGGLQKHVSIENHTRSMVSHGNDDEPNDSFVSKSSGKTEKTERVVQDEPGVYLTLLSLPDGGNELKRVRFSRKHFTEDRAENWWTENEKKVCERYNIRIT